MLIRTHGEVTDEQELQNLIVSIVLRQPHSFTKESCLKTVNQYLTGSNFYAKEIVETKLENTIEDLIRFNKLNALDGVYSVREIRIF